MQAFRFRPRLLRDLRSYRRSDLSADLLAGLVVGIVALPLAIAFAIAASPGSLPLSVGGGIGQSRLCMYYLQKAHIGEIQASIWPEDMRRECAEMGITLI